MKLTPKQKAFADYYIQTGNAYHSAIKSGYSENYAKGNVVKLLENESVRSYIDEHLEVISSQRIADAKEVMEYLTKVMRGETTAEVVVVEGTGDGCSEARQISKTPDEKERIKAAELLGKRYSMWTDKIEANVQQQVVFNNEQSLED